MAFTWEPAASRLAEARESSGLVTSDHPGIGVDGHRLGWVVDNGRGGRMAVFTDGEVAFLPSQRLARLATASKGGQPDVSAVGFAIDGDTITSGGST
jgi:Pyridoxamine 5'-phosphate oxidase